MSNDWDDGWEESLDDGHDFADRVLSDRPATGGSFHRAEDDEHFAGILVELAHERGFKALHASTGMEGIELTRAYRPQAILLDIGLPDIDGMAVVSRLKEDLELRHIPIHIISAHERNLDALRLGVAGYVRKPVSMEQIGFAFAFTYGAIVGVAAADVLANATGDSFFDYVYFSFVTITTVGYGDITALTDVGRALAIVETLLGQIFLVVLIAYLVGKLSGGRRARAEGD